jgi:2-polyprenyl-3-methyl-5-hydroxy-6-metoxy-1,4-benzoquinol methylase
VNPLAAHSEEIALRPCPLCNEWQSQVVFLTIRRCQGCGLHFVNPLGGFRGEHETADYFVNEYLPLHTANWENSLAERRMHLATIENYSTLPASPRILDVGCALGFMLQEAKAAGWQPVGVETSAFASQYAAQETDCPVFTGTLEQAAFETASFDVVTLMDVIEHVAKPASLMEEVYRILRPEGVVFVITPNFGSLFVKLYGSKAYGIGPDEHINYFQPATIRRLLRQCGFRQVAVGSKDFYAANLNRLLRRNSGQHIKSAFGSRRSLGVVRRLVNRIFRHVRIGDKLIALAKK